jgi:uncharacterized membrane protein
MTDCQETPDSNDYVLQFLREIRSRDKAILIGFMVARVNKENSHYLSAYLYLTVSALLIDIFRVIFWYLQDILMVDETQTRDVVERATLVLVIVAFILAFLYIFLPSRD